MAKAAGLLPAVPQAAAVPLAERILLIVLYVTVLASSIAFIEPSPHDALMGVLAITCLAAGVHFQRVLAVPLALLLVWNFAGLMALMPVVGQEKTLQYTGTSVYLAIAALLFACIFSQNTMPRLAAMRAAYVLTATVIALAAIAGYFSLFTGAHELFAPFDRALGGVQGSERVRPVSDLAVAHCARAHDRSPYSLDRHHRRRNPVYSACW